MALMICLSAFSQPRIRVIIDNDLGGDPDGLFQLAHQLLSPSAEVCGVIGSFHYDNFYHMDGTARAGAAKGNELLNVMREEFPSLPVIKVIAGQETKVTSLDALPEATEASDIIIREAMKNDKRQLYVLCGAGLTNIATALLRQPEIARRLTLVWIGGPEYADLCMVNPRPQREYNLGIDIKAAQVVFNKSDVAIWQIPRDAYRQCICSMAELNRRLRDVNKTGTFLMNELDNMMRLAGGGKMGETYVLGDSPLTLVTALQTAWEPDAASCEYSNIPCPIINDNGWYEPNTDGRKIRVFTRLDLRLMIEDFYAKIQTK